MYIFLDAFFLFIFITFLLYLIFFSKKSLYAIILIAFGFLISFVANKLNLTISKIIYPYIQTAFLFMGILLIVSDLKNIITAKNDSQEKIQYSSEDTKNKIADAVMALAKDNIGALITIERHNSLDQYAEKAIALNSDISKELLINIFTPNTPLHDGAVIIRGNKIRCAGAYYVLTQHEELDKTTGSRHRAGLGISEVTDSLTIIVSEETGRISIATQGVLMKIVSREKLLEYIEMFTERK